jgi:hypothetical protein
MRDEPLFIKFLNGQINPTQIIDTVIGSSKDQQSKDIALQKKESEIDLSLFREDFVKVIADLIDNGINQRVINYVNSYMKPSLEEFVDSSAGNRVNESRYISIKAADAPWVEAVICYNLCIFIKAYGFKEIKQCSNCGKFFSYKGQYAKYCSDSCKMVGSGK